MMITILHAADFHLDSAFGSLKENQAIQRRKESRETVERVVDYGNDHGAKLRLLAGDLFDSDAVYAQTADELAEALKTFRGEVVVAPGNHDYYSNSSPWKKKQWPENVHVLAKQEITLFDFPQLGCRVYGAAFTSAEKSRELDFSDVELDPEIINIGLFHGDVGVRDSRYCPISIGAIKDSGLSYLALGHVHSFGGVEQAGKTYWAYPGCLEGRGFDETGEKGFLFGTVDKESVILNFVPFAGHRYQILPVDISEKEPLEAIEDLLPPDVSQDIYRIVLTGETAESSNTEAIYEQIKDRFFSVEVRDKTTILHDIWEKQGDDSLKGLFLREMRRRYDSAETEEERQKIVLAVRFGLNAMDNREMPG